MRARPAPCVSSFETPQRLLERCSHLSGEGSLAASRRRLELPDVLALEHISSVPKCGCTAITRELGILSENLILTCASSGELEEKFHTEARASNTRLAVENLWIGDVQVFSHWSCLSAM